MVRRSGTTLIEVLVAIFVMSLGLLALLTLFPLGALTMAQAIKDDRTAHAAANATAIAEVLDIRNNSELFGRGVDFFVNPPGLPPADPDGPSYPVYVDPIGSISYRSLPGFRDWVAEKSGIPRRSAAVITGVPGTGPLARFMRPQVYRWFTLLDDIGFDQQGVPATTGGEVVRDGQYSWAYLLRRPRSSIPSLVELTVVVYSQRPLQLTAGLVPVGEALYGEEADEKVAGVAGANTLQINWGRREKPAIRKGEWILDVTLETRPNPLNQPPRFGTVHGHFYRVVAVTELTGNTLELELQTDLRANVNRVVVMEGVAEVFDKGTGTSP